MSGPKTVTVTCNFTIERNAVDWVEENKKSLQALQVGIEQQILAEINRLKRVTGIVTASKNIAAQNAIHERNGVVLDYLYAQLHVMFPEKHQMPTITFSAPYMREWTQRIESKASSALPVQKQRRIPRKYFSCVIAIALLLGFGLFIALLWAIFA